MKDAKYSVQFHKTGKQVSARGAAGTDLSRENGSHLFPKELWSKMSWYLLGIWPSIF